jgi:hypothetical protein
MREEKQRVGRASAGYVEGDGEREVDNKRKEAKRTWVHRPAATMRATSTVNAVETQGVPTMTAAERVKDRRKARLPLLPQQPTLKVEEEEDHTHLEDVMDVDRPTDYDDAYQASVPSSHEDEDGDDGDDFHPTRSAGGGGGAERHSRVARSASTTATTTPRGKRRSNVNGRPRAHTASAAATGNISNHGLPKGALIPPPPGTMAEKKWKLLKELLDIAKTVPPGELAAKVSFVRGLHCAG